MSIVQEVTFEVPVLGKGKYGEHFGFLMGQDARYLYQQKDAWTRLSGWYGDLVMLPPKGGYNADIEVGTTVTCTTWVHTDEAVRDYLGPDHQVGASDYVMGGVATLDPFGAPGTVVYRLSDSPYSRVVKLRTKGGFRSRKRLPLRRPEAKSVCSRPSWFKTSSADTQR